jgi:hypothetical protein
MGLIVNIFFLNRRIKKLEEEVDFCEKWIAELEIDKYQDMIKSTEVSHA